MIENIAENTKVKKKPLKLWVKIVIGIICSVLLVILFRFVLPICAAVGYLVFSFILTKPKVVTDIAEYQNCIGNSRNYEYTINRDAQFKIFPETISDIDEVKEFQYVYYNPFDPQYVSYMTIQYDQQDYEEEIKRLNEIGVKEYKDIYSVSDEPLNYDLVAMIPHSYSGFGYAMIPEKEDYSITYVGIVFCNYFLDLNINKYLPSEYLLEGFDATMHNPYEEKMMGRL